MSNSIEWCLSTRCRPEGCIHAEMCPVLKKNKWMFRGVVTVLVLVVAVCGFVNASIDPTGIFRVFTGPAPQAEATKAAAVEKVDPFVLSLDDEGFGNRG